MKCERAPAEPKPIAGLELALAQPEDAKALLELYLACGFDARSEDQMRAMLGDGRHAHAVARAQVSRSEPKASEDHQVGGLAAFVELETHWPRRPWLAFAGVTKERRDQGVGSALVSWLLARQFSAGAVAVLLALSPANRTALRAYEKVGFRRFRLIDALEKKL